MKRKSHRLTLGRVNKFTPRLNNKLASYFFGCLTWKLWGFMAKISTDEIEKAFYGSVPVKHLVMVGTLWYWYAHPVPILVRTWNLIFS